MVKLVLLLHRREGMSVEEFRRYAREQHSPLLLKLPGLTRMVINYAQPDHTGAAPPYDALSPAELDEVVAELEPITARLVAAGSH